MNADIIELVGVARGSAWHPWAVQYLFLVGLSVGAFLLTLPYFAFGRAGLEKQARLALLAALVCGLSAPVALLANLHQPARVLNLYLHFLPDSWMAWGAWFLPAYVLALLVYAWLALKPDFARATGRDGRLIAAWRVLGGRGGAPRALRFAAVLALVFAALVFLYTGMELMAVRARPLWNTPLLPLQLFVTGLAGAIGWVLVANRWLGDADARLEARCNRALALAQCLVLALGVTWLALGASGASASHSEALAQVATLPAWQTTAAWALAATIVPIVLAAKWPTRSGLITGLIALHSAWMIRWTVFIGGQALPKTASGAYDYSLPLGSDGLLGILGTAGLCFVAGVVLVTALPWAGSAFVRAVPALPDGSVRT